MKPKLQREKNPMAKLTQRIAEKVKVRNIPALIRQNTMGIIFLLGALFIWLMFVRYNNSRLANLICHDTRRFGFSDAKYNF